MSSNPIKPAGSTASTILTILQESNGYISLGIQLAGVFVPLAKALIQKIEGIGTGSVTITLSDLVLADQAELDKIAQAAGDDLAAINVELVRMGIPPLVVPPADPPPPAAA
jgi:hypothetical protein